METCEGEFEKLMNPIKCDHVIDNQSMFTLSQEVKCAKTHETVEPICEFRGLNTKSTRCN